MIPHSAQFSAFLLEGKTMNKTFTKNAISAMIAQGKLGASITLGIDEANTKAEAYYTKLADTMQQTMGFVAGDVVPYEMHQQMRQHIRNGWMQGMIDATGVSAEVLDNDDGAFRTLWSRTASVLAGRKITFGKSQTAGAKRRSAAVIRAEKIGNKLLEQASNVGADPYAIAGAYAADSENGVTQAQAAAMVEQAINRKARAEKAELIALRKQAQGLIKDASKDELLKVIALF